MKWFVAAVMFWSVSVSAVTVDPALAHPPVSMIAHSWNYQSKEPVYQFTVRRNNSADVTALALSNAVKSVRPEFRDWPKAMQPHLHHYVLGRVNHGDYTTVYVSRRIIADWLKAS